MKRFPHLLFLLTFILIFNDCKPKPDKQETMSSAPDLKISLAQWSLHKAFQAGDLDAADFPIIASRDYDLYAVEYVNGFYADVVTDQNYWKNLRKTADSVGVTNLLIMVDEEGDLGSEDPAQRQQAVENHYKWLDAAAILGCHSIRVNAFGEGNQEEMKEYMTDALKRLGAYAAKLDLNVLIENHGLNSSDGQWVASLMEAVDMPNVGTLPDFGNWCTSHKWGSIQKGKDCDQAYNIYEGVRELMPYARGVSAKSYDFDDSGKESNIDYDKMLSIVKDAGFSGYIGIEYEGDALSEPEGIRATKSLLESVMNE
jgi:sugar phosphate isomerase/epimerase